MNHEPQKSESFKLGCFVIVSNIFLFNYVPLWSMKRNILLSQCLHSIQYLMFMASIAYILAQYYKTFLSLIYEFS